MVEVSLTVGKLDASLALLLTKDHHLIEFPTILLPDGVSAGSVVTIKCERDIQQEKTLAEEFERVQEGILNAYGTKNPKAPVLKIKNVTQTSAVLEWDPLDLGSATIKSLTLFKNGSRLGQIPNPLINRTTKLSGLPVDTPYEFYLKLTTTSGVYNSEVVSFRTHKMTDLTGIAVCIGEIDPKEGVTREDIEQSLSNIGAKPLQDEVKVDTTHFIATLGLGAQWKKALNNNIPVVRPEWLKACELERRIVGVRNFYLDADPKFLENNRFHQEVTKDETPKETSAPTPAEEPVNDAPKQNGEQQAPSDLEDVPLDNSPEEHEPETASTEPSTAVTDTTESGEVKESAATTAEPSEELEEESKPKEDISEPEAVEAVIEQKSEETIEKPKEEETTNGEASEHVEEPTDVPVAEVQKLSISEPTEEAAPEEVVPEVVEESEKPVETILTPEPIPEPKLESTTSETPIQASDIPAEEVVETNANDLNGDELETVDINGDEESGEAEAEVEVEDETEPTQSEETPTPTPQTTNKPNNKNKKKNKKKGKK